MNKSKTSVNEIRCNECPNRKKQKVMGMDDKDRVIFKLWQIIDDIDTYSDMCKENLELFSNLVHKKQEERWNILNESDIDKLYDKYYKKKDDFVWKDED